MPIIIIIIIIIIYTEMCTLFNGTRPCKLGYVKNVGFQQSLK